ncbi:hypothetical protein GT646_01070 [Clostridium butyricum]|uniref:hypothetical protein n=1 Tax=Clostridium butyricum TaxID=1492 RepID=UPI001368934D|nr:hypothetical protein [Clostridium butyricum]MZI79425.1 hypothetical protein [Clostridium butyricum]
MSENLLCPLKFNLDSQNNKCVQNCAWNAGSKVEPRCALIDISYSLNDLKEFYEFTKTQNEKEQF